MNRILIIPNIDRDPELLYTRQVLACLQGRVQLTVSRDFSAALPELSDYQAPEALYEGVSSVVALGGDGTLLRAAREAAQYKLPVLGVNLGHLGFLAEVEREEICESLELFLAGRYTIEKRMMIHGSLQKATGESLAFEALNDIVLARSCGTRLIDLNVCIDGEFVDDFKADGMIVATPTGSTAYSMSAGGPIVDPALSSFLITPICPHKLYAKNLVVPDVRTITMTVSKTNPLPAMVTADGQGETEFFPGDTLTIQKSDNTARLIRLKGSRFYTVLHQKLLGKER